MTDPMPRKDVELPPRMPEAAIIAALRTELAQARAVAEAAVAVVVEKAAEILDGYETIDDESAARGVRWQVDLPAQIASVIRALAPEDAIAEVVKLRAKACAAKQAIQEMHDLASANAARADTLAAELAAANAREAGLREAVEALGAMPEGYCFCSRDRIGNDSKVHEPECQDIRDQLQTGEE